jgi:hypothetical protein
MLLEYEIANCTRRCTTSGRTLTPGEEYYSTLHIERGSPVRQDFAADAWQGPPADAVAWWQARVPASDDTRGAQTPQDVLVNLFAALADEPAEAEFRYVLGLLLVRRRIVKLEQTRRDAAGEVLMLDCPRREEQFELRVCTPSPERQAELERRLGELLFGGG